MSDSTSNPARYFGRQVRRAPRAAGWTLAEFGSGSGMTPGRSPGSRPASGRPRNCSPRCATAPSPTATAGSPNSTPSPAPGSPPRHGSAAGSSTSWAPPPCGSAVGVLSGVLAHAASTRARPHRQPRRHPGRGRRAPGRAAGTPGYWHAMSRRRRGSWSTGRAAPPHRPAGGHGRRLAHLAGVAACRTSRSRLFPPCARRPPAASRSPSARHTWKPRSPGRCSRTRRSSPGCLSFDRSGARRSGGQNP